MCLKNAQLRDKVIDFHTDSIREIVTYLLLFCFELQNVHTLLTPNEREKIFGEPYPRNGKHSVEIFGVIELVLSREGGVAIYYLKS